MKNKKELFNDFGLGTKTPSAGHRVLNKDGSFNVRKTNIPLFEQINFFHSLINMSWTRFFGVVLLSYFIVNIAFASIYLAIGVDHLTGIDGATYFEKFIGAFFFSAQTVTTLGYGLMAPTGILANSVAALESMLGLLSFALATGLIYGRFSKPRTRIRYSTHALIAPYRDVNGFMLRVVNLQRNQLIEVEATAALSMKEEGRPQRDFYLLELERSSVAFFPHMWTIVHPIDDASPLKGLSAEEIAAKDAEFIIVIKAFDESFSQMVYSRSSYRMEELKWGEKFINLVELHDGHISVDVSRIDETEKAELNLP